MTTAFRMPTTEEVDDHVADLSKYSRIRYCAGAPIVNECPQCGEAPGWDCKSRTGYTRQFHAARVRLVESWDVDRRIAAYAKLRIIAGWQQAEARARMDEFNADPAKVAARNAGWARQREAMARIDRDLNAEKQELSGRCADTPYYGQRSHADDCRCLLDDGEVRHTPEFEKARRDRTRLEDLRGALPVSDLSAERARRRGAEQMFPSGAAS